MLLGILGVSLLVLVGVVCLFEWSSLIERESNVDSCIIVMVVNKGKGYLMVFVMMFG